ncbi:MAG: putative (4-{4-[2-(gamma-L-glutamylamino)ethyl]phenoxymethyl}furan-2-yl)methanamine synthase [Promethearchaeota archaeon]|nr:MAG: putative (4-{4-[2-(gamma-L-glutamylamino)ethyl]phenoxymethyl}furan-2-yl)methanamine synthase [Candidatus Lokiarchaeota archaeon]
MGSELILGLDIGGANTKAALLKFSNEKLKTSHSSIEYFPFWEKSIEEISGMLKRIIKSLVLNNQYKMDDIAHISVTITAELSDAFQTKKEGITTIIKALKKTFNPSKLRFISTENIYFSVNQAEMNPYKIAAANWVSTALFLGYYIKNCILVDAGSTTIDVIPIKDSTPIPIGKTDVKRLMNHELIYTGGLRATIPSITHFVPYKNKKIRISFEKFALVSDVHRILGNISEVEYINDTADNRSKSIDDCYARLARTVCLDSDLVSEEDLDRIAEYVYKKQVDIILKEFVDFMDLLCDREPVFKEDPLFIITGLSANFLIRKALEILKYQNIKTYEEIVGIPNHISSSAYAVAAALYYQNKGKKNEK